VLTLERALFAEIKTWEKVRRKISSLLELILSGFIFRPLSEQLFHALMALLSGFLAKSLTLKMEAVHSFETLVTYHST
jgi:hypothetical protein